MENGSSFDIPQSSVLRALVVKYSTAVPRYTSYPTAVEFTPEVDAEVWREHLQIDANSLGQTAALYVHVPFCQSLCYFCACNKKIVRDDSGVAPYLSALAAELSTYRQELDSVPALQQLHWGGGTPNFLSVGATEELFRLCSLYFPDRARNFDASVEIDPRTITVKHLETYRSLGVSRISAGVQDFCPRVQKAINRIQPYEQTKEVCDVVRSLGFSGLNLDLIYGLPEQTEISFADTVEKLLSLRPDRIALYGYAHVTWKKKVQKTLERSALPDPELRIQLFLTALKHLTDAGYIYIGMDHFALPDDSLSKALENGTLNRNFMGYTTNRGSNVLGIGVSSVSSIPTALAQNTARLDEYIERAQSGDFAIDRGVVRSMEDRIRAELIEDVLCQGVIKIPEFEERWGISFRTMFCSELLRLSDFESDGLLRVSESAIRVEPLGRLFLRNIASVFDSFLAQHRTSSKPVFSQSV